MNMLLRFMGMKLRAVSPVEGPKITVVIDEEEARFMYEYFERSLEIANYNGNVPNANMLKKLMDKTFNGMYNELKVRTNMEHGEYKEFEKGGEFA